MMAAALTVAVAQLAPASPASALPSCSYEQCNGWDPNQTVCASGATTLASFWQGSVLYEVRYSGTCHASWARATGNGQGSCNGWTTDDMVRIEGSRNASSVALYYEACVYAGQRWTSMIGFHYWVRVCHVIHPPWASQQPEYYAGCTGWH
jgi:hypothetical protein